MGTRVSAADSDVRSQAAQRGDAYLTGGGAGVGIKDAMRLKPLTRAADALRRVSTPAFETSAPPQVPATPSPTEPSSVHELKTLVLSRHPAIAIETVEEERADALLAAVAADTHLSVFDWTITQGLVGQPGTPAVYGTQDPARMLATVGELTVEGLFVLKDFSAHLATPAVSRAFRELLGRSGAPARLARVVWVGAGVDLPAEVESQVVRYELRLPDRW